MNLHKLKAGDEVYFRCGGHVTVREVLKSGSSFYRGSSFYHIGVRFENFGAVPSTSYVFTYDEKGNCGQVVTSEPCPFDIVARVKRKEK
jgi:hypothetical protein